jgi:hypothetical protein
MGEIKIQQNKYKILPQTFNIAGKSYVLKQ